MGDSYVKVHSSILDSTVWLEKDATVRVWFAMMIMADASGYVGSSIPGLANRARVSLEACEEALQIFLSPDKYSRSPDDEGRRIAVERGGWRLINHERYRGAEELEARREQNRQAQRRHRQRQSAKNGNADVTSRQPGCLPSAPAATTTTASTVTTDLSFHPPRRKGRPRLERQEYPEGLDDHLLAELRSACPIVGKLGPRKVSDRMRDELRKLWADCEPTPGEISHVVKVRLAMTSTGVGFGSLTWASICRPANFQRWLAESPARSGGAAPPAPRPTETRVINLREAARQKT